MAYDKLIEEYPLAEVIVKKSTKHKCVIMARKHPKDKFQKFALTRRKINTKLSLIWGKYPKTLLRHRTMRLIYQLWEI